MAAARGDTLSSPPALSYSNYRIVPVLPMADSHVFMWSELLQKLFSSSCFAHCTFSTRQLLCFFAYCQVNTVTSAVLVV